MRVPSFKGAEGGEHKFIGLAVRGLSQSLECRMSCMRDHVYLCMAVLALVKMKFHIMLLNHSLSESISLVTRDCFATSVVAKSILRLTALSLGSEFCFHM